jgi:hypothetical protein
MGTPMTRRAVPVIVLVPLLVVALAVSSSACGTIMNFAGTDPPLPFGGVVSDVQGFVEYDPVKNPGLILITPFVLVDICLSAVFDAATLPVVGWMQIRAALESPTPPGRPPVSGPLPPRN